MSASTTLSLDPLVGSAAGTDAPLLSMASLTPFPIAPTTLTVLPSPTDGIFSTWTPAISTRTTAFGTLARTTEAISSTSTSLASNAAHPSRSPNLNPLWGGILFVVILAFLAPLPYCIHIFHDRKRRAKASQSSIAADVEKQKLPSDAEQSRAGPAHQTFGAGHSITTSYPDPAKPPRARVAHPALRSVRPKLLQRTNLSTIPELSGSESESSSDARVSRAGSIPSVYSQNSFLTLGSRHGPPPVYQQRLSDGTNSYGQPKAS